MKTIELYVFTLLENVDQFVELVLRDAEFILIETSSDVFVGVCIDVRIDSDRYSGLYAMSVCHLVDDIDFLK